MSTNQKKQVRLAAFGFDERACEGFRLTFRGPGANKALLVDEQSADFGIINMDSADAKALLDEYERRYPGRPAIKLSVKEPAEDEQLYVKKPASIDDMLGAINTLIDELESLPQDDERANVAQTETVACGNSIDTTPVQQSEPSAQEHAPATQTAADTTKRKDSKKQKVSIYYNPKDYLQGEIHSAVEYSQSRGLVVELWVMCDEDNWKKIVFMPRLQKVLTSLSNRELWAYCSSPLSLINHKLYRRNEKESATIQDRIEVEERGLSYEAFLWKVALYTSQGRLPQGTSLDTAARLKHWPNLTRLYPVAGSMRITTLLVDQPRALPVIAKVLKIPAGRVFAFYSAACAIGVAGGGNDYVELAKQTMPQRHRDHTLFGRILKRLKKDSDSDVELYA